MEELTQEGKDTSFFEVAGVSMWPFLSSGQKLIIKRVPVDKLRVGDIIIYKMKDSPPVCHRLVSIKKSAGKRSLYCRGDASFYPPELVENDMVLGRASGVVKNNRIFSMDGNVARLIQRLIACAAPLVARLTLIARILLNKR